MAKVKANILLKGLSGKLTEVEGMQLISRVRNGKTSIYFMKRKPVPNSPAQKAWQAKFSAAATAASALMADPATKASYKKKAKAKKKETAYTMAMADCLKKEPPDHSF